MDIVELIRSIVANNLLARFEDVGTESQLGVPPELFLGATLLPERAIEGNTVEDEAIRYRSVIANDAARYSPTQLKEGAMLFGSILAKLAESDIGKEFTAQQYDNVKRLLSRGGDLQAQANFLGWLDTEVNQALQRKNELYRWQAIVDGAVTRLGDNGFVETVSYPNPSQHRRTVAASWSAMTGDVSTNDPFDDLFGIYEDARDSNVIFSRVIMSTKVQFLLMRNTHVQERARFGGQGFIPPNDGIIRAPMALPALQAVFQNNGFPAPEIFDGAYEDFDGTHRYLHEDKIVFVGQTGTSEVVAPVEGDEFTLDNTLGYLGVGYAAGQDTPGRVLNLEAIDKKPPRIEVEGYQTSLPVITSAEKLFVLDTTL